MADVDVLRVEAEGGDADAQYRLAMALWEAGSSSSGEGLEWLQKAADQGHAEAQYQIGSEILSEESPESKAMLLAAAEQGHAAACMDLCYHEVEFGLPREGFRWYRRGRELGHPHDANSLGIFGGGFDKVFFGTHEAAIARAEKQAKRGHPEMQYLIGTCHAVGEFSYRMDASKAYAWFVVSGLPGAREAQRRLEGVFDTSELHDAKRLAAQYVDAYRGKPTLRRPLVVLGLLVLVLLTVLMFTLWLP